jgi:hypothetical protein
MVSVNQTRPHCVNQMGKTHSKPLAARHGRGTAWAWNVMCESALNVIEIYDFCAIYATYLILYMVKEFPRLFKN